MTQLNVLSGSRAGTWTVARRFPFQVGRAHTADLQLQDAGVWDNHAALDFDAARGFIVSAQGQALLHVNGQPAQQAVLRNGDLLDIGSAKLQFWLAETRQRSLRWREAIVWLWVGLVTLGQFTLLYWLLR